MYGCSWVDVIIVVKLIIFRGIVGFVYGMEILVGISVNKESIYVRVDGS